MNNMFERYAKIENTRMIFDFMCELDQRCVETRNLQYNGNGGLKQRFEIVQVLSNEIDNLIENSKSKSKELFLYQNPLTQYIIFWNEMYKQNAINFTDDKKTYLKIISNMLNYFRCIKCLDDMNKINIKNDDLPYIYEDICLSICNITNSHMCYILCQDANNSIQTVMTSSCIIDSDTKSVLDINADKLIENACTPKNEKIGGIYYYCVKDNKSGISNGTYIVISLPEHYYQDATDRKFYIVLQKKKVVEYNDDFMKTLSMILFLKDRFISVLKRDFAVLLNLRFDVSYIKSINIDFEQAITILHLSDLHVTENKKWDITSKTVKEIIKKVETSSSTQKIDLIAITGDIVQASNNANSAQEKYMKVEKIIQEVAVKLWGENKEIENELFFILPHDWKRRILITTGNHDYAAMNDVMVQTKSRVIKSALPSKSQGGTMSKFTYYIEFMQHFLDAPIDKLINHDLNEVRFYRNLNLNVLILNSVSLANSLQNNKVGFDSVKVTELTELFLKDSNKKIRRICLSHHSPEYEINYVNDIYAPYNLFDINKCEKLSVGILYSCFCRCIKEIKISESIEIPTEFCENLKKAFNAFEDMITEYQNNEVILEIQEIVKNTIKEQQVTKKEIELWIKNFYESDLYSDIKGLYDYICKNLKNEFSLQLLNKLNNMHQMEYFDNNNYKEIYKNILNNNKSIPIHAVFSGHEHKKNENNIKIFGVPLYVESKFETGGSIITIKNNGEIRERKAL